METIALKCPHCGRDFVRCVSWAGFSERLLSLFYLYTFKCQLCGERFRSFRRGGRSIIKEDRREYDRMERKFPITFIGHDSSGEGVVLDVSMGGCTFSTVAELAIGTVLKVDLSLSAAVPPVIVDAAVVRNVRTGVAGVEFVRWRESERERLQLFMTGMLIGHNAAQSG